MPANLSSISPDVKGPTGSLPQLSTTGSADTSSAQTKRFNATSEFSFDDALLMDTANPPQRYNSIPAYIDGVV
jgi:hypothetical protein